MPLSPIAVTGSATEESTIQVMKLLCYEFADLQPVVLKVLSRLIFTH